MISSHIFSFHFFFFHFISLLHLFNSSSNDLFEAKGLESCKRSWIPLLCSLGIIMVISYKKKMLNALQISVREKEGDGRSLTNCVEELKKKGRSLIS
ncbi:hypothetical protein NC652_034628 [Populus alba x Populus x berolinensis]|nr:hypothetical protein NC652_034628 [Populus alba x Populus x berolinensis]